MCHSGLNTLVASNSPHLLWYTTSPQVSLTAFQINLPRSPLSRASARGGFRSFSKDSSWGLASSMSRSKAGLSKPCGDKASSPGDEWDCCTPGCRCRELEVPGTDILRKSIRGMSVEEKWLFTLNDPWKQASEGNRTCAHTWYVM